VGVIGGSDSPGRAAALLRAGWDNRENENQHRELYKVPFFLMP
jgi:hypothetical protein